MFLVKKQLRSPLFVFLLFSFTFIRCAKEKQNSASTEGIVEPTGSIERGNKTVCFAEGKSRQLLYNDIFEKSENNEDLDTKPIEAEVKKYIQQSATYSFNSKTIGFDFVGWKVCPDVSSPTELKKLGFDIALFAFSLWKQSSGEASHIGTAKTTWLKHNGESKLEYIRDSNPKTFGIGFGVDGLCLDSKRNKQDCVKMIAVHEFGHLLGLRHEHVHPEAKRDPVCFLDPFTMEKQKAPVSYTDEPLSSTSKVFDYDKKSVMNYCHMFAYLMKNENSEIKEPVASEGDIEAVKEMLNKLKK